MKIELLKFSTSTVNEAIKRENRLKKENKPQSQSQFLVTFSVNSYLNQKQSHNKYCWLKSHYKEIWELQDMENHIVIDAFHQI